jgi:hypothetical protein
VGEKVDATTHPRKSDRDIQGATADMLAGDLSFPFDDVDQRLADH